MHWNVTLKTALKLIVNKTLRYWKKVNMLDSKIYADFESILVPEDNG